MPASQFPKLTFPGFTRRCFTLAASAAALAGCSSVGAFNALVPFDSGAELIADGIAYGSLPRQKLDIYAPPSVKDAPTILFFYGGSWNSGSRSDYGFLGRALASRGFVVAIADYRLVPEVRYPTFLEDGALALKWLFEHASVYGGDPRKLFVMGHSAGAYNAIMIALDPSLTTGVGLHRQVLKGAIGLSGPYDFLPLQVPETRAAFGQWPRLLETQPINHVSRFAPPMFLASGGDDDTVYPANTIKLAQKLREAGRSVEEHIYPELGHAGIAVSFSRPFRSKSPVLSDVARFVRVQSAQPSTDGLNQEPKRAPPSQTVGVRRQGFWDNRRFELTEALAH